MNAAPFDLGVESAESYLRARGLIESAARITELGGGISNTVLLVETPQRRFVLKQALSKLRVEQEWLSDRSRIFREADAMNVLSALLPANSIPAVLLEDRDNFLFAMTAAPEASRPWKDLLMEGAVREQTAERAGLLLAGMAAVSWRNPTYEKQFGDQTVFHQLRIDPYYRTTALRHPDLQPQFAKLLEESSARRVCLVHGDWSPKNFLVDGDAVMAIDFEVIHFGDPAFDVAFLLNHLLMKSFHMPARARQLSAAAHRFWNLYRAGLPGENWIEPAAMRHLGWLLLSRIDGKSPADYLRDKRDQVRQLARSLILSPPDSVAEVFPESSGMRC